MNTWLAELRRRHVFRVAAAYGVVAWLVIQAASIAFPAFGAPDWVLRVVIALAVLGLPVAVALAWAYELTPDGVRRATSPEVPEPTDSTLPARPSRWAMDRRAAGYLGVGMIVALVTVGSVSQFGFLPFTSSDRALPSIAVLPFQNITGDPANDFFSAGIHEDVMTQLYKLGGMTVISRTSVMQYRGGDKPLRTIAQELGVGTLLEASVRRVGDRVRIDARLIDAATDRPLWAESYDRELRDVLGLQAEIAQQIAGALHARLSSAAISQLAAAKERQVDPEMYEVYLRGLYEASEGRHSAAIEAFRRALVLDGDYAPAYAGIARSYYALGFFGDLAPDQAFEPMRDAAQRALGLDPDLADAHASLALFYLHYAWNWDAADQSFRRALELSPNHAQVRHDYAHYLLAIGRVEESIEESSRAAELDPGNMMLKACAGWHGFTDREYDRAVMQAMDALMMMPAAFWPEMVLGWAYQHQARHAEAIAALRNAVAHSHGSPLAVASLAHALGRAGERTPARHLLTELLARADERYVSAYDVAVAYAGLGDSDESLRWLRRAYEERSAMLVHVGWDPHFDELRDEPRFERIVRDLKLPDRPPSKPQPASPRAPRGM